MSKKQSPKEPNSNVGWVPALIGSILAAVVSGIFLLINSQSNQDFELRRQANQIELELTQAMAFTQSARSDLVTQTALFVTPSVSLSLPATTIAIPSQTEMPMMTPITETNTPITLDSKIEECLAIVYSDPVAFIHVYPAPRTTANSQLIRANETVSVTEKRIISQPEQIWYKIIYTDSNNNEDIGWLPNRNLQFIDDCDESF